nr:MAG TPA: glycosyltransferase family protein [Caudoviricetes sp.]
MIPKIIHLCWFSNDPFPVEIKVCLDTWKRILLWGLKRSDKIEIG